MLIIWARKIFFYFVCRYRSWYVTLTLNQSWRSTVFFASECSVKDNLMGFQCSGLSRRINYDTTELCSHMCCSDPFCSIWEFGDGGCWHGNSSYCEPVSINNRCLVCHFIHYLLDLFARSHIGHTLCLVPNDLLVSDCKSYSFCRCPFCGFVQL